jgi:hypothetical protein
MLYESSNFEISGDQFGGFVKSICYGFVIAVCVWFLCGFVGKWRILLVLVVLCRMAMLLYGHMSRE